ncbi:MAG TPA: TolC family protein [Terriglobales bacterium]
MWLTARSVGAFCFILLALSSPPILFADDPGDAAPVLTLNNAIQIAIANNRPLQISSLEVNKSKWQVASAKTKRLPIINTYLFASGNLNSPSFTFPRDLFGPVNGSPVPAKDVSVQLSSGVTGNAYVQIAQPISQLYKVHLYVREQELSGDHTSQEYRAARQNVVSDVKQAYYAVLQTESALDAAQVTVKQYEETDRISLQYVSQEVVLKSESLEVKAKLAQSQYEVVQLNNNLQTQKEHLNDLMGRDIETPFRTEQVPTETVEEIDLKVAQQAALSQRPELKEAEINVQKADYDRRLAKAQYIPDVSAAFHYLTPINTSILPQNIVAAGMEFSWDPFDWGQRRDEVKQKSITVEQSQIQLKQTQSKILLDVNNHFRKLQESRQLLGVAQAARDASNEKLREVNDKFKQQTVLLRDVLQQQTSVANSEHDYEQALLSFWSAKAEFEKALGEE